MSSPGARQQSLVERNNMKISEIYQQLQPGRTFQFWFLVSGALFFIFIWPKMLYGTLFPYSFTLSSLDMLLIASLNMHFMRRRCIVLAALKSEHLLSLTQAEPPYVQLAPSTGRHAGSFICHQEIKLCSAACLVSFLYTDHHHHNKNGQQQRPVQKSSVISSNPDDWEPIREEFLQS